MHDYTMRGHPRHTIVYFVAVITLVVLPLMRAFSGWAGLTISITGLTVFAAIYFVIDRYIWRLKAVRGLCHLPDLNGTWSCTGQKLNSDGSVDCDWEANITIVQTWTKLTVKLRTANSGSSSTIAAIEFVEGTGFKVMYMFVNDPNPSEPDLRPHRGTCELIFDSECTTAEGRYFTDHNRQSFGTLKLKRAE